MEEDSKKPEEMVPCLTTGLGFGSLLFLMNWAFGEVSLITRWTVRAYPDSGPEPNPWGYVCDSVSGLLRRNIAIRYMYIIHSSQLIEFKRNTESKMIENFAIQLIKTGGFIFASAVSLNIIGSLNGFSSGINQVY